MNNDMVKRQRKGFVARLLSLVVVVLILAAAAILRDGRILGHDLREAHEAKALKNDTLEVTPDGAFVVNTKPLAKDVQGYGGPVPLKIHIKDGFCSIQVLMPSTGHLAAHLTDRLAAICGNVLTFLHAAPMMSLSYHRWVILKTA